MHASDPRVRARKPFKHKERVQEHLGAYRAPVPNSCSQASAIALVLQDRISASRVQSKAIMAPGASRRAARSTLIKLLNYHWVLLGPANIFKVSYVNKPSPAAKFVVVPPAETCQADCKIARMWACLFWGLQTIVAAAIVQKKISDEAAAAAKLYVGLALVVAFASDVVREPVACAGGIEIVCGVLLLLRARESREWAETRRRLVREGTLAKDK